MSHVLNPAVSPAWDSGFAASNVHGERAQCELLREAVRHCKQKRTAVDIGAHIGLWTRNLASRFKNVLAFEPVGENFACLAANTAGIENVLLRNVALGPEERMCSMKLPDKGNSGMWHLSPGAEVHMETLDQHALSDVDLIKMDVEGWEGAVIRGAFETIRASKPVIVLEDNGTGPRYFGEEWDNPKPLLASLGYAKRFRWRKDELWLPTSP